MYNTIDPAARHGVHTPFDGSNRSEPNRNFFDFPACLQGKTVAGDGADHGLSDAEEVHKEVRLGFRFSFAVEQYRGELAFTDSPAADFPSSDSHLTNYPAAGSAIPGTSRRALTPEAVRAATGAGYFGKLPSPSQQSFQQEAAVEVVFSRRYEKQLFAFTPSELDLSASSWLLESSSTQDRVIDLTSIWEVR